MMLTAEQERTLAVARHIQSRINELQSEQDQVLGWIHLDGMDTETVLALHDRLPVGSLVREEVNLYLSQRQREATK